MNLKEAYIEKIKSLFEIGLNSVNAPNIKIDYHEEHYNNPEADCDVIVAFYGAPVQPNVLQMGVQIMVQVNERFESDLSGAMTYVAMNYNTAKVTLNSKTYRLFFNTPMPMQKFQNVGVEIRSTLTMEASFSTFNNVLDINKVKLETTFNSVAYSEDLAFLSYAMVYTSDLSSTGALTNTIVSNVATSCLSSITVSFVPSKGGIFSVLRYLMMTNNNANQKFKITIEFDDSNTSISNTSSWNSCIVQTSSLTKDYAGFPILQITVVRSD